MRPSLHSLEEFLSDVLNEHELRALFEGFGLGSHIPGAGVTLAHLCHEAISLLHREDRLDVQFFSGLLVKRGQHAARVRAFAEQFGVHLPARNEAEGLVAEDQLDALEDELKQRILASQPVEAIHAEIARLKGQLRRGRLAQIGDIIVQRYELLAVAGEGSFSIVFKAWDRSERKLVAVKALYPRLTRDSSRLERFKRGTRIMKQLSELGASVPRVEAPAQEDQGQWFCVLEYLSGGTLEEAVSSGQLDRAQILNHIQSVATTLTLAHKHGLLHRDVKPNNIILDASGKARLTDFDLVRAPDTSGGTGIGGLGTFMFAAPEVLRDASSADERADVFSLAMTTLFALQGGDLHPDAWRDARAYMAKGARLPMDLVNVLSEALEWDREARTRTVEELCKNLCNPPSGSATARPVLAAVVSEREILGIDFGTTQSAVAIFRYGRPVLIPNEDGTMFTPSAVGFPKEGVPLIGRAALALAHADPSRVVFGIKRHLGKRWSVEIDGKIYSCTELIALVLAQLRKAACAFTKKEIDECVLAYPAYFYGAQLDELCAAAELAGLRVLRCVAEPTAAAFSLYEDTQRERLIAVYDLGGGTFDISLVEISEAIHEAIAVRGDVNLGGNDFDDRIVQYALAQFEASTGVSGAEGNMFRLRQAVEQAKILLSTLESALIFVPSFVRRGGSAIDLNVQIKREEFRNLVGDLVGKTLACCRRCLQTAYRTFQVAEVDELILVGQSTQIPFLREAVEQFFDRRAETRGSPDAAVALGAALQGAILGGSHQDNVLVDVLAHGLGLMVKGGIAEIVPMNTTLPIKRSVTFLVSAHKRTRFLFVELEDGVPRQNIGEIVLPMPADELFLLVDVVVDVGMNRQATTATLQIRGSEDSTQRTLGPIVLRDMVVPPLKGPGTALPSAVSPKVRPKTPSTESKS